MHRIDGPGATVDNRFTEGDPVSGIQATVVTDDFLNDVQEEIISVLAAAGITPVKGTQDQLYKAISGLSQTQKNTAFIAGGTGPTFTLTPSPAIAAYAENQRFQIKFTSAGGSNPTLNVSTRGAKNLKQYNSAGAKVNAIITAGLTSDVFYDGTDFIVLDQLAGSGGTTAAQFDSSTNLATTEFVQRVGIQYSRILNLTTSATLVAANAAGALVAGVSNTAFNVTLPISAGMPAGSSVTFWNFSPGVMTVLPFGTGSGADSIFMPAIRSSVQLSIGEKLTLVSNGSTGWLNIEKPKNTATFSASSFSQNADTGEILQYFEVAIGDIPAGGRTIDVTFPFAFPNAASSIPSIVLRSADATIRHVSTPYYSMLTSSGFRMQIDEAAQVVQPASLTAIVTARGR